MMQNLQYYTVKEATAILKVSQRTTYQLIYDKRLKASRIGKEWRIAERDLLEFLQRDTNLQQNESPRPAAYNADSNNQ